ncbi:MAG TPA: hypothetical protein VGA36_07025 [Nitriliruptorales bacterium]
MSADSTSAPLLEDYLVEWMKLQRGQLQRSTWRSYAQMVHCYLIPSLGTVPLDERSTWPGWSRQPIADWLPTADAQPLEDS